jgi:hypothetical protein
MYRMAGHHLIAYILRPESLVLHVDDATAVETRHAPAVMVIEGTRRCCLL